MESAGVRGSEKGEETELERGGWGSRGGICFLGGNVLPWTLISKAEGAEFPICDLLDAQERWQERVTDSAGQTSWKKKG